MWTNHGPGVATRVVARLAQRKEGWPRYPAVQDRICGLALVLPLNMVVKPNVLPLPLDRMVITLPVLSQVGLPFQVVEIFCGAVMATTTAQVLAPVTVTDVL
jgi:hypothetical protein